VRAIRASLPGQVLCERLDAARLQYGELYSLADIRRHVIATLPWRLANPRTARVEPVGAYAARIPDEALLKYDDAVKTRLFSAFFVVSPAYDHAEPGPDPWIIGEVADTGLYAVIAQWV
jgi:hypothetical protein